MTPPLSKLKFSSNDEFSISRIEFYKTMMIDLSLAKFLRKFEFKIFTFKGSSMRVFEAGSSENTPPVTF